MLVSRHYLLHYVVHMHFLLFIVSFGVLLSVKSSFVRRRNFFKISILAFHVSLSPVIVCQIVGLERYSSALGLTLMFRGITSLTAPPVSIRFF